MSETSSSNGTVERSTNSHVNPVPAKYRKAHALGQRNRITGGHSPFASFCAESSWYQAGWHKVDLHIRGKAHE